MATFYWLFFICIILLTFPTILPNGYYYHIFIRDKDTEVWSHMASKWEISKLTII